LYTNFFKFLPYISTIYIVQKMYNSIAIKECMKIIKKNKIFTQTYPQFLWI